MPWILAKGCLAALSIAASRWGDWQTSLNLAVVLLLVWACENSVKIARLQQQVLNDGSRGAP